MDQIDLELTEEELYKQLCGWKVLENQISTYVQQKKQEYLAKLNKKD